MATQLLLGNEALAQGAIDAGLSAAYAYPGTPSTEITEHILRSAEARSGEIRCRWAVNEKTALEAALGASYAGLRAMASMKHVGLNVAADPFVNAAIAGAHGGLLVNVADDPSMHSSQNEQDSRLYADLALVPCLEPSDQQEAYAVPAYAFELSERHRVPVLIRLTTRLAHSRATVEVGARNPSNRLSVPEDPERFILLPAIARRSYERLVARQPDFVRDSEESPFNHLSQHGDRSLGIVACGIAHNYLLEVTDGAPSHPILKVGQYPLPERMVRWLVEHCDRILVLEDGYPFVEAKLSGLPPRSAPAIHGRLSGDVPRTGELTPDLVAAALGRGALDRRAASSVPAPRPPALCPGCPHADTCKALHEALASQTSARVFSDIGCSTLAALPPLAIIDTCVEMGASITMAHGASEAGLRPAVALIGDSTFAHSGMTGLLDCVNAGAQITVIIVDNLTVAMTGGQRSAAENRLASICRGLGVEDAHIRVIEPHPRNHAKNVAVLDEEIRHPGPSVIIAQRECIQTARRAARRAPSGGPR
ncbi:MAG: thiamine pyrophosphate-dependent enzyme [Candidatus Bipolaricaulis sp.]|nr:thiamine pyrophosphate-dependent enzyme [Candidatus Bipolaricaulis sp.]